MNNPKKSWGILVLMLLVLAIASCGEDENTVVQPSPFEDVELTSTILNGIEISTWMYQIQFLEDRAEIDALDNTPYDMLVVEPGHNFSEQPYETDYLVEALKQKQNGVDRLLLAYIDIGQAEDYRTYWQEEWVAPTEFSAGSPEFLLTIDPDGWEGNFPVAYWDAEWNEIWTGTGGIIEKLAEFGFDGVYLDWVEGYDDDSVRAAATSDGVDPENEMMLFIEEIGNIGRAINPDFLIVPQNAQYLLDADPSRYASMIDALATEDTWFYGEGDVGWEEPGAGDLSGGERHAGDYSTANRIAQNQKYLDLGIPVFSVDYCVSQTNATTTYVNAYESGFIPLVTRVALSDISETPPPFE